MKPCIVLGLLSASLALPINDAASMPPPVGAIAQLLGKEAPLIAKETPKIIKEAPKIVKGIEKILPKITKEAPKIAKGAPKAKSAPKLSNEMKKVLSQLSHGYGCHSLYSCDQMLTFWAVTAIKLSNCSGKMEPMPIPFRKKCICPRRLSRPPGKCFRLQANVND
jgi:hypothetical protein